MSFTRSLLLHQEVVAEMTPHIGKLLKLKCAIDVWKRDQTVCPGNELYLGTIPSNTLVVLVGIEPFRSAMANRITFILIVTTGSRSGETVIADNYGTTPEGVLSWFEGVVP